MSMARLNLKDLNGDYRYIYNNNGAYSNINITPDGYLLALYTGNEKKENYLVRMELTSFDEGAEIKDISFSIDVDEDNEGFGYLIGYKRNLFYVKSYYDDSNNYKRDVYHVVLSSDYSRMEKNEAIHKEIYYWPNIGIYSGDKVLLDVLYYDTDSGKERGMYTIFDAAGNTQ